MDKQAEALKKQSEAARAVVKQIEDMQGNASPSSIRQAVEGLAQGFQYDVAWGAATDPEQVKQMQLQQARDVEVKRDQLLAQKAELEKKKKARDEHREKAAAAAAKKESLNQEIAPEFAADAAANPGTVAYENAQQTARQKDKDKAARENADASAFEADKKKIDEDSKWLETHAPTPDNISEYRAKIKEMSDALNDALAILQELSSLGADTRKLGTALGNLQREVGDTRIIAELALSYAHQGN